MSNKAYQYLSPENQHFAIVNGYDWYKLPYTPGYYWVLKPDVSGGWGMVIVKVYEKNVGVSGPRFELRINYGGPAANKKPNQKLGWLWHGPLYEPSKPDQERIDKYKEEQREKSRS